MPLIPWRPFWEIEKWFEEEWPEIWEEWPSLRFPGVRVPRVNVYETEKEVIAEVELPGLKPEDIDVEVEKNHLKIEAKKEEKKEEKEKGYYRKEIKSGFFKRVLPLPTEVDEEKVTASYEQGILKVVMPKKAVEKKKKGVKIKIKGEK